MIQYYKGQATNESNIFRRVLMKEASEKSDSIEWTTASTKADKTTRGSNLTKQRVHSE
jgi:hypothetical protein